jgi:hypothetical protein
VLGAAFFGGFVDSIVGGGGLIHVPALLAGYPHIAPQELPGMGFDGARNLSDLHFPLLRSRQKPRFFARGAQPAETKLMSDKRAGARLVDRRSTRRVPSSEGQAQKAPQATFSRELRAAFPVPRPHAPAVTLSHPLMADPMTSRTRWRPMTGHPLMTIADPTPVTAHPDVTRNRSYAEALLPRRRWCDHHDAARIMPLIRNDDASDKRYRQRKIGSQTENVGAHATTNLFFERNDEYRTSLDSAG